MSIVSLHVILAATAVPAIERALEQLLGEPWVGALRYGAPEPRPVLGEDGAILLEEQPDPYPGAAVLSWQGDLELATAIVATVGEVDPTAYLGRGLVLGLEDDHRTELAPYDPPRPLDLIDPRESPALLYERWLAARAT